MSATSSACDEICETRVAVATVYVEAVQVWFNCPHCELALGGFLLDPRGQQGITCEDCGGLFDIPRRAAVVIA